MRVVVLISGRGSNLGALLRRQDGFQVVGVVSNRPGAAGLDLVADTAAEARVVDHKTFPSREAFDQALAATIAAMSPDLVVLAGFMRVLGAEFTESFRGRMINIHPSLLPLYRGLHTHQRALDAGDTQHGVSVHYVTAQLDGGPVIAQARLSVQPDDTADTLAGRVLLLEHQLLPWCVSAISRGDISLAADGVCYRGVPLDSPLEPLA